MINREKAYVKPNVSRQEADIHRFLLNEKLAVPEIVSFEDGELKTKWLPGSRTLEEDREHVDGGEIIRFLTEAINRMHFLGIFHGDLHPGNILVRPVPMVLDFGRSGYLNNVTPDKAISCVRNDWGILTLMGVGIEGHVDRSIEYVLNPLHSKTRPISAPSPC